MKDSLCGEWKWFVARREDIDTAIWDDPDFRRLSSDAKFVYIWTFTNGCGMAGVYKLDRARVTFDTGIPPARADKALEELCDGSYLVMADPWVWVRTRVKRLRARTKQMAWSVCADLEHLSEGHPIRAGFVGEYLTYSWLADQGGERWRKLCDETVFTGLGVEPNAVNLNRTSPEVHPNLKGNGNGVLSSTDTSEDNDEIDAPERIFNHWRDTLSPGARFTEGRRAKVRARLKNYGPERIIRAIDGCAASDFHADNNHTDLTLICRSDEKLEWFEGKPLKGEGGMRNADGTKTTVGNAPSRRDTCRRCDNKLSEYQANTQSGMCDPCYGAYEDSLLGPQEVA